MKLEDINNPKLRTAIARIQLEFWRLCELEAAKLHPNWTASNGKPKWLGGRTGPRTPRTLLKWFVETHPDEADQIHRRFDAMLRFSGRVTTKGDLH